MNEEIAATLLADLALSLPGFIREQELKRRAERRAYLRACLQNESFLEREQLTNYDLKAHEAAIRSLKRQELVYEKMRRPGYWQRLWAAFWGH